MRAVVSVIGKDMVGILAKVSAECENANMNVIEVSQTLLQDMFAMIMLIDITKGNTTLADFAAHMENGKNRVVCSFMSCTRTYSTPCIRYRMVNV